MARCEPTEIWALPRFSRHDFDVTILTTLVTSFYKLSPKLDNETSRKVPRLPLPMAQNEVDLPPLSLCSF